MSEKCLYIGYAQKKLDFIDSVLAKKDELFKRDFERFYIQLHREGDANKVPFTVTFKNMYELLCDLGFYARYVNKKRGYAKCLVYCDLGVVINDCGYRLDTLKIDCNMFEVVTPFSNPRLWFFL